MQGKRYRTANRGQEYTGLEEELQSILRPVYPRPEFIGDLRHRLKNKVDDPDDASAEGVRFLLVLALSFLTIVTVVMVSIRVVILMASAIGLLRQYQKQRQRPVGLRVSAR